jgi:hypothetical protein
MQEKHSYHFGQSFLVYLPRRRNKGRERLTVNVIITIPLSSGEKGKEICESGRQRTCCLFNSSRLVVLG